MTTLRLDDGHRGDTIRRQVDVLVVGGGPCGLTAALAAARRGLSVELVEAAPSLGGMAASFTVAGQRVDLGSHRLHPSAPPGVLELLNGLLGSDLQARERNGRLRLRDRWVRFPLRPGDMARNLPPACVIGAATDALIGPFRRATDDSYAEFVRAGLGSSTLTEFHGPMATKLWGLPPERLSAELARKRISQRTPTRILARVASTTRNRGATFLYPRHGYGQITERLAEAATEHGARLRTGCSVVSLAGDAHRPTATLSGGEAVTAGRVLWTAPADTLRNPLGLEPVPTPPMRGMVLVYVGIDQSRYTPFDAHYVPTPGIAFSRFSEPKNYRNGPDPADRSVLCFEIPCSFGDEIWSGADDGLVGLALDGLARLGLPTVRTVETAVRRLRSVYPVLTLDDAEPGEHPGSRTIRPGSEAVPGVTVLGRQGLAVADNLHHVIDMALSAVDCLDEDVQWRDDVWLGHRRRFEHFVVED